MQPRWLDGLQAVRRRVKPVQLQAGVGRTLRTTMLCESASIRRDRTIALDSDLLVGARRSGPRLTDARRAQLVEGADWSQQRATPGG